MPLSSSGLKIISKNSYEILIFDEYSLYHYKLNAKAVK